MPSRSKAPIFDELRRHTRCRECRYDLKGLPITGPCPECGTPISKTVPHCPRCRATHGSWRALRPNRMMDVPSLTCDHCEGLGLDRGALRRVVRANQTERVIGAPGTVDLALTMGVDCGRCQHRMQGIAAGPQALIDRCTHCGLLWIDQGELPAIVDAIRRHMRGHTPPSNLDELLHDHEALQRAGDRAARSLNGPPLASNRTMSALDILGELATYLKWL